MATRYKYLIRTSSDSKTKAVATVRKVGGKYRVTATVFYLTGSQWFATAFEITAPALARLPTDRKKKLIGGLITSEFFYYIGGVRLEPAKVMTEFDIV